MNAVAPTRGRPRPGVLVRDAVRAALARPAATATTALVVAVVCVVVLATTGRSAATEAQVLASVDSLGTRLVSVVDTTGTSRIDPSAVRVLSDLQGVEWVFGLGPASDVTNPAIGWISSTSASARPLLGDLPADLPLTDGRQPRVGEAVVGSTAADALRLTDTAAPVETDGDRVGVVGEFNASGPLASLDNAVLVRTDDPAIAVRYLYVLAERGTDVEALADTVRAAVPAGAPSTVDVEVSSGALELRDVLSGTLGASARQLMAIVLSTGMALVVITMLAAVNARRRDFGRQRALGASRSAVVVTVLVHSAVSGGLGTAVGLIVGLPITHRLTGAFPTAQFTAGLAALTFLVALAGSVPPALAAAWRDPLRTLRVP